MQFRLGRLPYGLVLAGLVCAIAGLNVAHMAFHVPLDAVAPLWWLPLLILVVVTAMRLRDIRWNPFWSAVCIIPFVGLVLGIFLCTKPSVAWPE